MASGIVIALWLEYETDMLYVLCFDFKIVPYIYHMI